jgi:imidazoleglycerol phosphate synthase glutamine amidotransferase subunit HisH
LVVLNGSWAVERIFAQTNVEDALTVVRSLEEVILPGVGGSAAATLTG